MLYKYLSEIIIGQVLNPFKGYLNLFKDLSKLFEYKTTSLESSYIWKPNYCFAELVVFVLGFHITVISYIPTYIHIHIHIHTSHSFNHLLILIHGHLHSYSSHHTPHSVISYLLANMKQPILICFIGVNIIVTAMFKYCSIL